MKLGNRKKKLLKDTTVRKMTENPPESMSNRRYLLPLIIIVKDGRTEVTIGVANPATISDHIKDTANENAEDAMKVKHKRH